MIVDRDQASPMVAELVVDNRLADHAHAVLIRSVEQRLLSLFAKGKLFGTGAGVFNLVLGFDHWLSEGHTAGRFLGELRERLARYEETFLVYHAGNGTRRVPRAVSLSDTTHAAVAVVVKIDALAAIPPARDLPFVPGRALSHLLPAPR